jgi:low temperature requirement protein LtrA
MKPAPLVQRVSTLELFFDLVFVFTITQLTAVLREEPTLVVALHVVLMLAIIFWMYGGYVWLTNAVSADRASRRLVLLAGMAGFFIVALTVPDAFDGGGLTFGLAYPVVVAVHIGLFSRASRVRSILGVLRLGRFNAVIATAVVVGGAFGGAVQPVVWSVVVLFAWLFVPRISPGSFDIGAAHFVERHGLVVIVAIGELVVALGLGLGDLPVGPGLIGVALLGLFLLMGIVSIAAAVEEVAHHPADVRRPGRRVGCGTRRRRRCLPRWSGRLFGSPWLSAARFADCWPRSPAWLPSRSGYG